jgi:lambda family phage portal protein
MALLQSRVLQNWLGTRPGGLHGAAGRAGVLPLATRPAGTPQRRNYASAQVNRLTEGWTTLSHSANAELHAGLDILRARARQLARDSDYAKKYLQLVTTNIVGANGFQRQQRVVDANGQPDSAANDAIESAWARWSAGPCDAAGRATLRTLCRTMVLAAARDGEVLARWVRGSAAGNPFGLALQLLDVERIDTQYNRPAENGQAAIRLGVEIDTFGRPLAYWLRHKHPGDLYDGAGLLRSDQRTRVPAEDVIHAFKADRPEQVRGVTWMHASMGRLNNQAGYEEAAIVAARTGASKMGFFTAPDGDAEPLADSKDAADDLYTEVDPGSFGVLPAGYGFTPFNPDYPSAMFGEFVKANLRGAASGLGVAYHALANDLEGVNFSSIRSGTLEERDNWQAEQEWFIESVLERIDAEWLPSALAFGQVVLPNGTPLPLAKLDKFRPHLFIGRRWEWVDPLKDIEADVVAVGAGLQSPQRVAAKLGRDYEDILVELKAAEALRARIGVTLQAPAAPQPKAAPAAAEV